MKYLRILILIGLVAITSVNGVYGLWVPETPDELFKQSETVFVGNITSVNNLEFERSNTYNVEENGISRIIIENYTQTLDEYTVDIEEFLKNPQTSNTITMLEATVGGVPGRSVSIGGFELGDRVLFFIPKIDGTNQYSPESFRIPKQCDAQSVLEQPRITLFHDFKILQDGIEKNDNFTANKPIEFVYNKDMDTLKGKNFAVDIKISKITDNEWETILEENIHTESKPCEWISTASLEFVPTAGRYYMWMHASEGNSTGGATASRGFNVLEDTSYSTGSVFPHHGYHALKIISPLKQIKSGVPINEIECKNYKHVLTERPNGKPACVYYSTAEKLGWKVLYADSTMTPIIFQVLKNEKIFDVAYYIKGGTVQDMIYDEDAYSLLITIDSNDEGTITLELPRDLTDTTRDDCPPLDPNPHDDRFFVLLDGEEVTYDEILVTPEKRTLQIQFSEHTANMEIIPICLI